jgi:hypothetical protein
MDVRLLTDQTPRTALPDDPTLLTISVGGEDELPQGPQSFDVLEDGSFVIADPVRERLVFYDPEGNYESDQPIGLAAMSVSLNGGSTAVRGAKTGAFFLIDETGEPRAIDSSATPRGTERAEGVARLIDSTHGVITTAGTRGTEPETLDIRFESDTGRMVSLQSVGTDRDGNTYVALETTSGGDAVDIVKIIRRYSPDGRLVCEIRDISLDYYVQPTDEFRVRSGIVYQLVPGQTVVLINVWNTN